LYRRLQRIEAATPAAGAAQVVVPRAAVRDLVPLDPREVSLLLRMEQGGDIVHSSVHALSALLGDQVRNYRSDEDLAGLALLVCRQHEQFPHSLSMTLCAVRSDGFVASVMPTRLLDDVSGHPLPDRRHQYAAKPTLEGYAPAMHRMDLADMFTATNEVLPLRFVDAFCGGR
jgi:hypothetical protein